MEIVWTCGERFVYRFLCPTFILCIIVFFYGDLFMMSLRALKVEAHTPPKGRRVITRSWGLKTNPTLSYLSSRLPMSDAVGAMVISPVMSSTSISNPCLSMVQTVEAPFICGDKVVNGSVSDNPGKLSIYFCGVVSVNSN